MHPVGTTMSENGPSDKYPVKTTNSDEKLKKAEESTHTPPARPVVDKKGAPSKHEAQLDHENDKEGVSYGSFAHAFDCLSKWWKKKDSGTTAQGNCLDEKEKGLPSKYRSLFQGLFWRGSDTIEANAHGASGPHMAKPKGTCHFVLLPLSIWTSILFNRVRQNASYSWCSCGTKSNFRGVAGDLRLAAPTDFIRFNSAGKLDSF